MSDLAWLFSDYLTPPIRNNFSRFINTKIFVRNTCNSHLEKPGPRLDTSPRTA